MASNLLKKKQCAINSHPSSLLDSFAIKHTSTYRVFKTLTYRIYSTTDMNNVTIATTALKSNSSNSSKTYI